MTVTSTFGEQLWTSGGEGPGGLQSPDTDFASTYVCHPQGFQGTAQRLLMSRLRRAALLQRQVGCGSTECVGLGGDSTGHPEWGSVAWRVQVLRASGSPEVGTEKSLAGGPLRF